MKKLKLERPIVFMDFETTGLEIALDRIIEISMVKILPSGGRESFYSRVNPEGRPIAPGAKEKHGISLEDLEDCPKFKDIAPNIKTFMEDCDLGGYNCRKFDIPILVEEFIRCGMPINTRGFKIVDVYKIFTKAEPRTLEAIYERMTGKNLSNAHSAEADIHATIEVLDAISDKFDVPDTVNGLDEYAFGDDDSVDFENKLKRKDGKIIFNFGKYKGLTIEEVFLSDRSYYDWLISSNMTMHTRTIFMNIVKMLSK